MATIKFLIKGTSEKVQLNIRISSSRKFDIQKKTGIFIPIKFWNIDKKRFFNKEDKNPIIRNAEFKSLLSRCNCLLSYIDNKYYNDVNNGVSINVDWLEDQIDIFFGRKTKSQLLAIEIERINDDKKYLINYLDGFIETKLVDDTIAKSTLEKYKNLKCKLNEFSNYTKCEILINNCDKSFFHDFQIYLEQHDRLMASTAKRTLKNLKTVLRDARINGYEIHPHLDGVKTSIPTNKNIYLSFQELNHIEGYSLKENDLIITRDWLLIGCYSGQRISDFMKFSNSMRKSYNDENGKSFEFLEFVQKKTKKKISVPLHPCILSILAKYNNNFPPVFSESDQSNDAIFNKKLKKLLFIVGINEFVTGRLFNDKLKRNEIVTCEKYKIATSHICRRSFATNYYGSPKFPTPVIMAITGHRSEKTFLEYIGKNNVDYAMQFAKALFNHEYE